MKVCRYCDEPAARPAFLAVPGFHWLQVFTVEDCAACGETASTMPGWLDRAFQLVFAPFWHGEVPLTERSPTGPQVWGKD